MHAYIYQAALLCEGCAKAKRTMLDRVAADAKNAHHNYRDDSDKYPIGPYADGGGEADSPQHCDHCHVFLENPLTADGLNYTREKIREDIARGRFDHGARTGDYPATYTWQQFYGRELLGLESAAPQYEFQLWSNYGYGWDHEITEDSESDIQMRLKEYRANTTGQFRVKRVRL